MPELPEVETVKNILKPLIIGQKVEESVLLYPRVVQSKLPLEELQGHCFVDIERRGKFLVFTLDEDVSFILHLRMEGKFFFQKELTTPLPKSLSFYLRISTGFLCFFDTRKFGVIYIYRGQSFRTEKPLSDVGDDAFTMRAETLFDLYHSKKNYLKEVLLDQSLMSGVGNIYADEILFASRLSPFSLASDLSLEDIRRLLFEARRILAKSIETGGSTVKSYLSSADHAGGYQRYLKAYSHEHEPCPNCSTSLEKRYLNGRGTTFCRRCQGLGMSVGVTGLIAVGKSTVVKIFANQGFLVYDCDRRVHELYEKKDFLAKLKVQFPDHFNEGFNRANLLQLLLEDRVFRHRYETFIYRLIRSDVIEYLNRHSTEDVVVEAPRLFEARLDDLLSYVVAVVSDTKIQKERLAKRGIDDQEKMLELSKCSQLIKKIDEVDFLIENNGKLDELEEKTLDVIAKMKRG